MSFNKLEQMRRAAEVNAVNLAQGLKPPVLPIPTRQHAVQVPRDKRGKEITLNATVVRSHPKNADVMICKVTKIDGLKVYLDDSHTPLVYNTRVVVI